MSAAAAQLQTPPGQPVRVLMVCLGNICRSPTAHGVLEQLVRDAGLAGRIEIDSAGTDSGHVGQPPDARAQRHARARGYDLSSQRARKLHAQDFHAFDLMLVMDDANEARAQALRPPGAPARILRLTDFCTHHRAHAVPDPYYGGADGFEDVLDLVEDACAGLLAQLRPSLRR